MLELKQIRKQYTTGGETVHALKGIDIAFRRNEFVSILGQSGCGKTTMLNIIGGLDRYTSGDLVIGGRSTREYKDRDWDAYRNHSIGFVFQSYNLIPHQSVLSNVELALTLSGVSKAERRKRAKAALEAVGLGDQMKKMPNQMSGGQMQRVAIARALVNNPDILLADEPTGALDSETSLQVMEILKEVAKDRLVIMVTHNPELAEKYSTRIVRLLDGEIISDSAPYDPETEMEEAPETKSIKKPSMSFFTAFGLSLNNLLTKKGRTILTAFAGSIGIIGIALILSLSSGVQNYIDDLEAETLTSYPITIGQANMDTTTMMTSMMSVRNREEREPGQIYSSSIMTGIMESMMSQISTNDLTSFRKYLQEEGNDIAALCSEIRYTYPTQIGMFTRDLNGDVLRVNPAAVLENMGLGAMMDSANMGPMSAMTNIGVTTELSDSEQTRQDTYELLTGTWPKAYDEVALIVNENYEITDYTLYALGLLDSGELMDALAAAQTDIAQNGAITEEIHIARQETVYSYEDFLGLGLKLVLPTDYYQQQEDGTWLDMQQDTAYMEQLYNAAHDLKVVGVLRTTSDGGAGYGMIGYTRDLTEYVIAAVEDSAILRQQKAQPEIDVFTGLPFPGTEAAQAAEAEMAAETVEPVEPTEEQKKLVEDAVATIPAQFSGQITALPWEEQVTVLVENGLFTREEYDALGAAEAPEQPEKRISDSNYDTNLTRMHAASLENPTMINLYASDFEGKEAITDAIDGYNDRMAAAGEDDKVIQYTDYVGMLMSSVTDIVNMVSYILIAFVGISLVVSSIMIGVITLISVQERTKEIGILRSIGASKRDVSRVFNAETLIIGLGAGIIGIGVTLLLNIPINLIIEHLSGVGGVSRLPVAGGIILVAVSVVMTMVAGLIPSKTAARKDPVEALRTE